MAQYHDLTFDQHERNIPKHVIEQALTETKYAPYWLDTSTRPAASPALHDSIETDLLVVGGGYTGLWTALQAKERDPKRNVVLIEAQRIGWAASGRNGGFCEYSLVHGDANGENHLPEENAKLTELGIQNLAEIRETAQRYDMDIELHTDGSLNVATEPHQVEWLQGEEHFLDADQTRDLINSPDFLAGERDYTGTMLVHPAKLAWELARVCRDLGVQIFEHTPAEGLIDEGATLRVVTPEGHITANRVALATNAFPSLLKRHHLYTLPLYDYALMTEPLTAAQREAIGWNEMIGLADLNNRFHYSRPTIDEDGGFRILWGGYDAVYHFGRKVRSEYDYRDETFEKLVAHFYGTFPQLEGIKFSHAWGGAIDSCSRFFAFFDVSHRGRVAYSAGYTGLGVGATRFGAQVMLDLLSGQETELTRLQLVRKKPIPFPPEPATWAGVQIMRNQMIRADRNQGERSLFLRALDKIGIGFDS
ncbi:FAD-dependent oxidoreductase [Enteractinococcus fodinae]|uniref:Glycine/D-amino acid oxidase-like deaminating enzyme n=1 Tax=Enteractinococcus fodinae TaxID=684663 RepID=A0ABU2B2U2_9MICC|nr:FAD-dependent oxidoreductase [Enteractinococcus fodinae]MDR7347930.1 glycine/D-amino acid oxidase-like deaminating enzyme [Enteractinococcus fodinae]